jgi:hypothetical protein
MSCVVKPTVTFRDVTHPLPICVANHDGHSAQPIYNLADIMTGIAVRDFIARNPCVQNLIHLCSRNKKLPPVRDIRKRGASGVTYQNNNHTQRA